MPPPPSAKPKLPSGGEFSPNQISLRRVLEIAAAHPGARAAAEETLRAEYFALAAPERKDPMERREQQRKRAGNVLIGMSTYGLYDKAELTELGKELLATPDDSTLHSRFAEDILRNRLGVTVVEAVRAIQARGEQPNKGSLATELARLGIEPPRATTHHLILLAWLRKAGVVSDPGYEIDDQRAESLLGVALPTVDEWRGLTNPQRALLLSLKASSLTYGMSPQPAQVVMEKAEQAYGHVFGAARDQLRRQVFEPLEGGGWVTMSQPRGGRGGKSGTIAATKKLIDLDMESIPAAVASDIPADLRDRLTSPLEQVYLDLESSDTYVKGIALELLAIKISTDLNITPRELRLRGIKTAGAEVDLVAEAAHLHFSRWLFQCKNTARLTVADLAKEVGMSVLLRAHVIVMVTTGQIGGTVRTYAKTLGETTALQAVLVDGKVLADYRKRGATALREYFQIAAGETLRLKRPQVQAADDVEL